MKKLIVLAMFGAMSLPAMAADGAATKAPNPPEIAKQAEFACDLSWGQITDVFINNKSPETAVDNAISKVKKLNPALDSAAQSGMKTQFLASLKAATADKKFADAVKNNTEATHKEFSAGCISETSKVLSAQQQQPVKQ